MQPNASVLSSSELYQFSQCSSCSGACSSVVVVILFVAASISSSAFTISVRWVFRDICSRAPRDSSRNATANQVPLCACHDFRELSALAYCTDDQLRAIYYYCCWCWSGKVLLSSVPSEDLSREICRDNSAFVVPVMIMMMMILIVGQEKLACVHREELIAQSYPLNPTLCTMCCWMCAHVLSRAVC